MSTQIDERVVAMRFDNKQFEAGAAESIKTLEKLNSKLDFSGAAKGFEQLEKSANNVTLSGLSKSAEAVEVKFSTMSIVAITAIERIVNSAMDAGEKLVKSMSIDQISSGFSKYESKINAVQATLNAVRDQGIGLEEVNAVMDKLSWYADETSYHFDGMSNAMSQFIAAGIDFNGIEDLIMGISNACGLAGVNAQKAEYAMTGFNKAIGQGYMTNAVWQNQLKTSGITNSKEFRQILIDTAAEMGTLTKVGEGMYKTLKGNSVTVGDINSNFSDMWLNTNVMTAAFRKFGTFSSEAFKLCQEEGIEASEAIQRLVGSTYEFSEAGFKASQEAKTFTDAIGAVQEAVSARWSKTFELIIGDEEEAIKLWTNVTEALLEVFAYGGDNRNKMLEEWKKLGGRASLIRGLEIAWENLLIVVNAVKTAFQEVFGVLDGATLNRITKRFTLFVSQLRLSESAAYSLKVIVKTLLIPLQLFFIILQVGAAIVVRLTTEIFKLINSFLTFLSTDNAFEEFFQKLLGTERYERFAAALNTIGERIRGVFSRIGEKFKNTFGDVSVIKIFQTALGKVVDILTPIAEWILDRIIDGLEAIANMDFTPIKNFFTWISDKVEGFGQDVAGVFSMLGGEFKNFASQVKGKSLTEALSILGQKFLGLFSMATQMKNSFNISGIFDSITNSSSGLINALSNIGERITNLVGKLEPAKILVFSFGAGIVAFTLQMANAAKAATSMFSSISGVANAIKTRIQGDKVTKIAKAIMLLAGSLIVMSLIDAERLKQATASMVILMSGLVVVSGLLSVIDKKILDGNEKGMLQFSTSIIAIAGAILILASALKVISSINMEGIIGRLAVLSAVMAALVVATKVMAAGTPQLTKGSLFLVAFALSISSVINSLEKLAKSDLTGIQENLKTLILVMGLLTALSFAAGKISFSGAAGITLMCTNILILISTLKKLNDVKVHTLTQSLGQFILLMGVMASLGIAMRIAGENSLKASLGLAVMSGAMLLLVEVARQAGELDANVARQGVKAVSTFLTLFAVLIAVSSMANENADKVGKGFLSMSASILILGLAVKYLGDLDQDTIIQGMAAVSAFLGLFTVLTLVGKSSEKTKTSIGSMAVVIGTLTASIALLTLLDYKEVLIATAALSTVLIAFGACMKSLQAINLPTALANIAMVGAVIASLSFALSAISNLEGGGLVEKATALAILVSALTIVSYALSKADMDTKKTRAGAFAIIQLIGILGLFVAAIGGIFNDQMFVDMIVNGGTLLKQLGMITPWIAAFGMIAYVLSAVKIDSVAAQAGAVAIDKVISIIGVLVLALGGLDELTKGKAGKWLEDGGQNLAKIGTAIGAFVGNLVGVLIGGIATGGLPVIAQNLADFSEKIVPFFENITSIDQTTVVSTKSVADALTAISNINTSALSKDNSALVNFANQLVAMADPMIEYSSKVDQIDVDAVNASSGLITSITNLLNSLPTEGGFLNSIFGQRSFGAFDGLAEFAEGIKAYSDVLTQNGGIDEAAISSSASAVQILTQMANELPKTGGKWQEWFGGTDLAKFGEDLEAFGKSLVAYNAVLSTADPALDEKLITSSGNAAKVLVELAQELPKSGGRWQEWFGGTDLVGFGEDLVAFGQALVAYNAIILGANPSIDAEAIQATSDVGQMMVELEKALPKSGGWWQGVTGSQDIGNFGEKLEAFGISIAAYGKSVIGISSSRIKESAEAASSLADLSSKVVKDNSWKKMDSVGASFSTFGSKFKKYYDYIERMDWNKYTSANLAIRNFGAALNSIKDVNTNIPDLVAIIKSFKPDFTKAGETLVAGLANGIDNELNTVNSSVDKTMENVIKEANIKLRVINQSSKEFETVGKYVVQGLANGIANNQKDANISATNMANGILKTTQNALGIHSPSLVFKEEVGKWIIEGIVEGLTSDLSAEEAISKKAAAIVNAFSETLKKIDIRGQLRESMFSWEQYFWPEDMSEEDKKAAQIKNLTGQLEDDLSTAKNYYLVYQAALQEFGEEAYETNEALQKYYQARDTVMKTAISIADLQNEGAKTEEENAAAWAEVFKFFNEGFEMSKFDAEIANKPLLANLERLQKRLETAVGENRTDLLTQISDLQAQIDNNNRLAMTRAELLFENYNSITDEELKVINAQKDSIKAEMDEIQKQMDATLAEGTRLYLQDLINEKQSQLDAIDKAMEDRLTWADIWDYAYRTFGYDPNFAENKKTTGASIIQQMLGTDVDIQHDLNWWGELIETNLLPDVEEKSKKVGSTAGSTTAVAAQQAAQAEVAKNGTVLETILGVGSSTSSNESTFEGAGWAKALDMGVDSLKSGLSNVGDMVKGFIKGEKDNESALKEVGSNIVEDIDEGVKNAAGIHSPSRRMIENAGYMVDGLIVGFENSYPQINEAMSNLISEMSNAVQENFSRETPNLARSFSQTITEAAARAEAMADGGTFTIRPVLDMSEVERQLKEFSSKVSSTTAHSASAEISSSGVKDQNGSGSSTTVINNNYNQTINTPKVASPLEIIRRTKNLMSQIIENASKGGKS